MRQIVYLVLAPWARNRPVGYTRGVRYRREHLDLDDEALFAKCDVHCYKSSGPGGQHRNKVSSAVRVKHRPTGVMAHGDQSRSQHENKALAIRRLRMNLACQVRQALGAGPIEIPPTVRQCIFQPRGRGGGVPPRLEVGRRDHRFWLVAAFLLDVLELAEGRLATAAGHIGISTGNLNALLKSDRHLLGAAQQTRKRFGRRPIG